MHVQSAKRRSPRSLSETEITNLRSAHVADVPVAELARRYSLAERDVVDIIAGRARADVPPSKDEVDLRKWVQRGRR